MSSANSVIVPVNSDEILTGEAVALDVQPLSYFLRALGTLIDVVVTILLVLGSMTALDWLFLRGIDEKAAVIFTISLIVIAWVVLPTLVEALTRGRSIGKLAVGGRIVRTDGGTIGIRHTFIRAMLGVLEIWMSIGGIAALTGALTPRSQRLGDLVAGTYCQSTRTPRLVISTPAAPPELAAWAQVADVARLPDRLARRVTQFAHNSERMDPAARARVAATLAAEVAPLINPVPSVPAERLLYGVAAVRRDRELRALELQQDRVDALLRGASTSVPGFPETRS